MGLLLKGVTSHLVSTVWLQSLASPCLQEHFPPVLSESRKASSQVCYHRPERPEGPRGSRLPSAPAGTRPLPGNATSLALGVSIPGAEAAVGTRRWRSPRPSPGGRSPADPRAEVPPPLLFFSSPFPLPPSLLEAARGRPGPERVDPAQDPPACQTRNAAAWSAGSWRSGPLQSRRPRTGRSVLHPPPLGTHPTGQGSRGGPSGRPAPAAAQGTGLGRCCITASLLLPNEVT